MIAWVTMLILREIRRRAKHVIAPLLGITALAYFGYHTVQGDRGLMAWWRLRHEIQVAEKILAETQDERQAMERRASLLRPDNLDPDLLEERARTMLNMGRDDEIVVFHQK